MLLEIYLPSELPQYAYYSVDTRDRQGRDALLTQRCFSIVDTLLTDIGTAYAEQQQKSQQPLQDPDKSGGDLFVLRTVTLQAGSRDMWYAFRQMARDYSRSGGRSGKDSSDSTISFSNQNTCDLNSSSTIPPKERASPVLGSRWAHGLLPPDLEVYLVFDNSQRCTLAGPACIEPAPIRRFMRSNS